MLQEFLPKYRAEFFDVVADEVRKLTVASLGRPMLPSRFKQIGLRARPTVAGLNFAGPSPTALQEHDVVFAMFDLHWPAFCMIPFQHSRPAIVLWGHGISNRGRQRPVVLELRRSIARRAEALLFYDQARMETFCAQGDALRNKSFIAPNTLIVSNASSGGSPRRHRFLFVGRLERHKELEFLIRTYASVIQDVGTDVPPLDIVGGGSLEHDLVQLVSRLGLCNYIFFHGQIHNPDQLRTLFHSALAVIHPGPLGLIVNHACAYGTPIISVHRDDHGPEASALNSANSLVVEQTAFADALRFAISNGPRLRALGQVAYETYTETLQIRPMIDGFLDAALYAFRNRATAARL